MRPDVPFLDAAASYLRSRHDLKPRSRKSYEDAFKRYEKFIGGGRAMDLSEDGLNAYLTKHRAHPTMARLDTIACKLLSRWMVAKGILPVDPLVNVSTPKAPKRRRTELPDTVAAAAMEIASESKFGVRDRAIVTLALDTGLRPNELRQLRTSDLDLRGGVLFVREETSKTPEGHRTVRLSDEAIAAVSDYLDHFRPASTSDVLWLNQHGDQFTENGWLTLFGRLRDRMRERGIDGFCAYRMRHTAITNWRRIGIHPSDMQQMAGHRSFQTTQHYIGKKRPDEIGRLPSAFSLIYGKRKVG